MGPLQRDVNQTLSHLKTIQYYISNQGSSIVKQVSTVRFSWENYCFKKSCEICEAAKPQVTTIFQQVIETKFPVFPASWAMITQVYSRHVRFLSIKIFQTRDENVNRFALVCILF